MKESLHTFLYAAVLGTACALLLTGAGRFSAPYRKANARADEVRNILRVLEVPFAPDGSSEQLLEVFENNVQTEARGDLTFYLYVDRQTEGDVQAAAVQFSGQGLWGPIKGFLSLEPDMKTIRGVAFHQQEETPGLGGEIASYWFQKQFEDRSIENAQGEPGIRIRRGGGGPLGPNEVDGITGATMTCDKVEQMLNAVIERLVKEQSERDQ